MSVNSLLYESSDKSWANLYVNSIKSTGNVDFDNARTVITFSSAGFGDLDLTFKNSGGIITCMFPEQNQQILADQVFEYAPTDAAAAALYQQFKPEVNASFPVWVRNYDGGAAAQVGIIIFDSVDDKFYVAAGLTHGNARVPFTYNAGTTVGVFGYPYFTWLTK